MDFEQAVEDWKAHDQWEFADKQAAWGFFFMAGRESKQRENEMDPHIDGVVPVQMTDAERGFLSGMLIGNLRRIYAAHDDEGNDLSALPSRAADEIERLQGQVAKMSDEPAQLPVQDMNGRILTCVYCGHEYPQDTPAAGSQVLTEHIRVCEKHPMRKAEADIALLRSALAGLIGADTKDELMQMEATMRLLPAPEADKVVSINAIRALLATMPPNA